ncbi:MAG: hypothetical protein K2Y39_15600 [Candidatus Obscuribacterales bacterium]|nr:hypothetical protein [Candidatus Obscuribacterales bacterium]
MKKLILLALISTFFCSAPSQAKDNALHVDYNFHDWGDLDVLILKDRVRIKDKLRDWIIILDKPDWKITCFSPSRKSIASLPYSQFKRALGERLGLMTAGDIDPSHWKKVGPATINGISSLRYDQIIDIVDSRKPTAQIYVAAKTPINPKIAQFLCRFFDIPNFQALPVRCTKRKIEKLKLDTRSIATTALNEADFQIPKGYATKTMEEVLFAQTSFDY